MIFQIQKWEENFSNYVFGALLFQPIHINANRELGRFLCNKTFSHPYTMDITIAMSLLMQKLFFNFAEGSDVYVYWLI